MASAYAVHDQRVVREDVTAAIPVASTSPRISWSAVLAGIVLAMAVESLLVVLGAGIGFSAVQPNSAAAPDIGAIATDAGLWSLGSTLMALLVGGWAAARLAGVPTRRDGMLHGLIIWALALLLTLYLISVAAGGAFSLVGGMSTMAGGGLRMLLPPMAGMNADVAGQQARALLQPAQSGDLANMSAEDAQKNVSRLLPELAAGGDRATQAHDRIVDIMSVQLKISHDDAAHRLDDARAKLAQDMQSAAAAGAPVASRAAFVAFGGLLAAAVAAGLGGLLARPRRQWAKRSRA